MTIARGWSSIVCVASGPSLDAAQCSAISAARHAGWRVIVVNDAWKMLPDADVLYACDGRWWAKYAAETVAGFPGERWTQDKKAAPMYGLHYVESANAPGLSPRSDLIHQGNNGGYQAIGLARLFGAHRIVLVGYDMAYDGQRTHFFGTRNDGLRNSHSFPTWITNFDRLAVDLAAAGVAVINCSARTALRCFLRAPLAEALASPAMELAT